MRGFVLQEGNVPRVSQGFGGMSTKYLFCNVLQLLELSTTDQTVGGSSPSGCTSKNKGLRHLVM